MANYTLYAESCGILQKDMIRAIQKEFQHFGKEQMSLACNPWRNALQLIPEAEQLLEESFGKGPGLSISPPMRLSQRKHDNKNKPNRLCLRLDNDLRSRLQTVYEQMAFTSMQDLLEAAVAQFVEKYERAA